jgi:hypothetical protein
MVPLYNARVRDLGPGDLVKVACYSCGHEVLLPPSSLQLGLHLRPETPILDLERKMRRRECDVKGKALVTVRWGE